MNFTVKQGLANVRPAKTETPEVSTTPTNGNFKVNSPGAIAIGVKSGDYLNVVLGDLGEGAGNELFICKGKSAVKTTGEDGKEKIVEPAVGAKLASANGKMGGTLQASSSNIYNAMKGNPDGNVIYTIDVENPQVLGEDTYYRLQYARTEPKQVKEKAEKGTSEQA